jgi:hypothetical protein
LASASGSPTSCHTVFFSVSSSISDGRAEFDGLAGQLRDVDDFCARELILELGDAPLVDRLLLLGGMILGILREIAVRARLRNLLDDTGPFHLLAVLQLLLERGEAGGRHRYFVHRGSSGRKLFDREPADTRRATVTAISSVPSLSARP